MIDFRLLKTIKDLTKGLEVEKCPVDQWEKAILAGYHVFNSLKRNKGGIVEVDLDSQTISYLGKNVEKTL